MGLSEKQKTIVDAVGKVVVKACPGSGKTYSVSARIARLLKENEFYHEGIAAISFTNTACKEINGKLTDFEIAPPLPYPHFIGTIDSFLNRYVFLPFGHLVMDCTRRPEIVGEHCHNRMYWKNPRKYARGFCTYIDPMEQFENVSFDLFGTPIPVAPAQAFNFSWNKITTKKGEYIKKLQDIIDAKENSFKDGYANQSDANYFCLQVLQKYPEIAKNIVKRFPYFIIDEAQDTNDIQMAVIDKLVEHGLEEIMLIGDPNQAIFEWNNAKPKLFEEKYKIWQPIVLDENRRSSLNICSCSNSFIGDAVSIAFEESDVYVHPGEPEVLTIDYADSKSIKNVIKLFIEECKENNVVINHDNVAVIYRSGSYSKYFETQKVEFKDQPWKPGAYHLRDIVHGKWLLENGQNKEGFKLIEQGFYKGVKKISHIKQKEIQSIIEEVGFVHYRKQLFDFINELPTCNRNLNEWLELVQILFDEYRILIDVNKSKSKVPIECLFKIEEKQKLPFYHGTIHSVKGCTFEAILILLGKKAGNSSNYANILNKDYQVLIPQQQEEMRIVYVGLTRPRKILKIGVPSEDVELWKDKLKIEEPAPV
ncbi:MAG: ATP-dependent helicase [Marinilabiliaceae bacterium]|nr:ATP-dependent helicase [Marinilabiliaceae bacterium]